MYYPIWHWEVESLLVLKNNRGVEDNRARHLDYGVQLNKTMYKRVQKNEQITLFSPNDVPGLYDAFFEDQDEFERLYAQYENDPNIRKRQVSALELFSTLMKERADTGRIYIMNVDHCNTHSPFDPKQAPIRQSNLCLEIALPTKPLKDINDVDGEISLCTLAAINLGVTTMDEFEAVADLLVRALDNLLDYQSYPVKAAELSTMKRRPLGIGVINYAYWLAKNGTYYSDLNKGNKLTHELFEKLQYSLLKASNGLAKEKSACPGFSETTYAKGLLPIDTYKKDLDDVVANDLKCDWETLRQDIVKYGLRNSTLTAIAPTESSSQVSNSTNGIEPPRGLLTVKASKDGILKQIVPEYETLGLMYETAWEMTNYKGYIQKVCIMQKFIDQAISANEYFDPKKYPSNKPSLQEMITNKLYGYKYGIKTWYYHNTRDGADDVQSDLTGGCESGACSV